MCINEIQIKNETHLLPGAVLLEDSMEFTKYIGNPAKRIGKHQETGIIIERG